MYKFQPDYNHILNATKNIEPTRLPLYEHHISIKKMEEILENKFSDLINGDKTEKNEFFKNYCGFFEKMG